MALCVLSAAPALAITDPFEPDHIALGPDGNIYALISGNDSTVNHIFVFAPDGRLLRTIEGRADMIAFDASGNLYASDFRDGFVRKMDTSGSIKGMYDYRAKTDIAAVGMGVGPDGKLYVSKFYIPPQYNTSIVPAFIGSRIVILSENGTEQLVYADNDTNNPVGAGIMAVDTNGMIYAISTANSFKIITPDGTATAVGHYSSNDGGFNTITGLSLGKDGYLYVSEYGNHRVQKLTTDGTFVMKWDGAGADRFLYPWGAAVDANGKVYVADPYNERIVWLTPEYTFGENTTDNLKGQGITWGNVYQGTNYTGRLQEAINEEKATSTPGFSLLISVTGFFLLGTILCLWRGIRR
ncbi:MAG TPA: NHL repeat-containing protein [Methanocella sp.]